MDGPRNRPPQDVLAQREVETHSANVRTVEDNKCIKMGTVLCHLLRAIKVKQDISFICDGNLLHVFLSGRMLSSLII
jgi:hypothetical protein